MATVELAYNAENKEFMAHAACQKWVTRQFYGEITPRELSWGLFKCPDYLKVSSNRNPRVVTLPFDRSSLVPFSSFPCGFGLTSLLSVKRLRLRRKSAIYKTMPRQTRSPKSTWRVSPSSRLPAGAENSSLVEGKQLAEHVGEVSVREGVSRIVGMHRM